MRAILHRFKAPASHWVGDGFLVRSLFSYASGGEEISPFLLFDYAGPNVFEPSSRRRGVGAHPHKGFETVTIVYSGEVTHRDSSGGGGVIGPNDVQWMTAAAGIVHDEFHSDAFSQSGGLFEVVQLWVNLPRSAKGQKPGYQTLTAADIPHVQIPNEGGYVRVIAGSFDGAKGPAKTSTPIDIWDLRLNADAACKLAPQEGHSFLLVVLSGEIEADGHKIGSAEAVAFALTGGPVAVHAKTDAKCLVLSGKPILEPIAAQGPFVMNTHDELRQAFTDFRRGVFGALPG